jgi:ABC-type glycerol-3-phosphate transport system substrate-binding protein
MEMQKQQAVTTGWAPIWEDLLVDEDVIANQPWSPVVLQQYDYPVNVYPSQFATERRQILADELMKAILLEQTAEEALQNAQAALIDLEG